MSLTSGSHTLFSLLPSDKFCWTPRLHFFNWQLQSFCTPQVFRVILCPVFYYPVLLHKASCDPTAIRPHLNCSSTASLCWSCVFCSANKNYLLKLPVEKLQLLYIILFKDKHKLNKSGNRHLVIRKMLWPNKREKHSKQTKTSSDKVLQVMIQDFPFPEFFYHTQSSTSKKLHISVIFASPHDAIWRK